MRLRRHRFRAMGSPCTLHVYAERDAVDAAVAEVARLERKYSRYRPDSLASRINASAGDPEGLLVDEETALLLDYADTCHRESEGLFDITSGVLRHGAARLGSVGWQRLHWQPPRLVLPEPGMELDFGGYVKEYAADRVAGLLRRLGVRSGLVDLGGDVAVVGPHPDGSPWRVGVRHPRRPGAALAWVDLERGAIASSGDYERPGHILDPRTGRPVAGLASVSVLAEQCLVAGTTSTVAMLKGERDGCAWLDEVGLPNLRVNQKGEVGGTLARRPPPAREEAPTSPDSPVPPGPAARRAGRSGRAA
jgi:thiamine biosynthesis lipoprotein